jgi:excisionase family DNA binding protein
MTDADMTEHTEPNTAAPPPGPPRLAFSVRETAAMLGVSEKSVRRLIARGLLRPSKALRHLLIPRAEIERFLSDTR